MEKMRIGTMAEKPTYEELEKRVRELEQAVSESKQTKEICLDNFINNIGDPVFIKDDQSRLILVNDAFCTLFDLTRKNIIGKTLAEDVPPDERESFLRIDNEVLATGQENINEESLTVRGGQTRIISTRKTRCIDNKGKKVLVGILHDITYRKVTENLLKNTLEATTDGIWTWDFVTEKMSFSSKYYTMLGYEPNEFEPSFEKWIELIHPDDRKNTQEVITKYLETKSDDYENLFRMKSMNGDYRWIRSKGRVVEWNDTGEPILMIGNHEDITERKQVEESLRRSDLIINSTMDTVITTDIKGTITYANKAVKALYGYEPKELMGEQISILWREEDIPYLQNLFNDIVDGKIIHNLENNVLDKQGNEIPVLLSLTKILDKKGKIVELIGIQKDIRKLKNTQEALIVSEAKYKNLVETASDAIYLMSEDGIIINTNQSAFDMLGKSKDEIIGSTLDSFDPNFPLDVFLEFWKDIPFNEQSIFETTHLRKDGSLVSVEVSGKKFKQNGKVYYYGIARDITNRKQVEEALKESEERFRELVYTINSGVGIYKVINDGKTGKDYIVQNFNKAALDMEGLKTEDAVGKRLIDLRPAVDDYGIIPIFRQVWKTGEPAFYPAKIYVDGNYSNYYENRIFRIPSGEIVAIYDDVTDKENATIRIKESEERFNLAMSASKDGLFDWNLITNEIYFSPGWKSMLGYKIDELPNEFSVWEKLTKPEDFKKCCEIQQEVINKQRDRFEMEFKMKHKDGHWVDILSRAEGVFDKDGKAVRIIGTHVDITYLKQAEEKLYESELRFSTIFHDSPMAIALRRFGDNKLSDVNNAWLDLSGFSKDEVIDKTPLDLNLCVDLDKRKQMVCELKAHGRVNGFDLQLRRKTGEIVDLLVSAEIIELQSEQYMLSMALDITDYKRAIDENEKNKANLQHSQKMEAIGTLAGGIAHDFNNILAAILGYTDLSIGDAPPGSELQKNLDEVLVATNRAKDLVKQILTFSRQEQVERVSLKLQPLIKDGLKLLRSSIPSTISITEHIDPECGFVLADPTQIHQILMNLSTNAYHAMETTGGELSVSLNTAFINSQEEQILFHLPPGEYVELKVSDNGEGISPDVIDKIFDPYFTTKGIGKGTGLGLAIIHGIVKDYCGTITVESQLGKGSTFIILIPVFEEDKVFEENEQDIIPGGEERLLVVDDEKLLAKLYKKILEKMGYNVTVLNSSIEALSLFQSTPYDYDLVITDQTMPDMTGVELSKRMLEIRPDIPIILLTGFSNLIDENSALKMGIKEFALKPLNKSEIAQLIRKVLE
jgi:PAS domain S-box-containing protein